MLDLSKAIHAYSGEPTFVSSFEKFKPVSIDLKSETFLRDQFHKVVPPKLGLVGNLKDDWSFRPNSLRAFYPNETSSPNGMQKYVRENPTINVDRLSMNNGTATLGGGIGCCAVGELAGIKFSKPLRVHWFLQAYRVAFAFDHCAERRFLRGVALATCGRIIESKNEYYMDCDPTIFRAQWIGQLLIDKEQERVSFRKDRIQMSIDILNSLTNDQVRTLLEKQNNWVHGDVSSSSQTYKSVQKFTEKYLEYCRSPKSSDDAECRRFKYEFTTNGGPDWSKGLRWQVSYPTIEFFLDKKEQLPGLPKFVMGF